MPERKIVIVVTGKDDTKGLFGSLNKQLSGLGKGLTGGLTKAVGVGIKAITGAAVAGGAALVGIAGVGLKSAIDVESAFAGVIKTTDGLTDSTGKLNETGAELKQQFMDLATTVPTSVEELMAVGELGGQLGVARENLIGFTQTIAAMGEATNLTREDAATAFAQIGNIMGTSQGDYDRMGSSIVALGNNFATTEADITGFAQRIAGAGKIAGMTEADVFGVAAAFSSVGIEAEAGGTAVQKVLMAMNAAVAGNTGEIVDNTAAIAKGQSKLDDLRTSLAITVQKQAEFTDKTKASTRMANQARIDKLTQQIDDQTAAVGALSAAHGKAGGAGGDLAMFAKAAGMSAEEFKKVWDADPAKAFAGFVQGLGAAGDDALGILTELGLEDQRLVRGFLSLGNAGDLVTRSIEMSNVAWDENTALSKEAGQRYATMASQLAMVKNTLSGFATTVGESLMPFLVDIVEKAKPFLTEFGERLPELMETYVIPALETVAEVGGKVVEFISTFVGNLQEGQDPLTAFSEALATFIPPETMAQITPIVDKIRELATTAIEFATTHAEELKAAFIAIGAAIVGAAIVTSIAGVIAALNPVTLIFAAIVAAAGVLAAAWAGDWGGIRTTLTEVWTNTLQPALETLVEWLQVNVPVALEVLAGFWTGTLQPAITAVWEFLSGSLIPLLVALVDVNIALLQKALEALSGLWQNVLLPAITAVANWFTNSLIPALESAWAVVAEKLSPAIDKISGLFKSADGSLGGLGGTIQKVIGWFGTLADKVRNFKLPDVLTPGSPTPFELGLRGIGSALGMVLPMLQQFGLTKDMGSGFEKLTDGFEDMVSAFSKLEALMAGGFTGGDVAGYADILMGMFMALAERFGEIQRILGDNEIKKLSNVAKRFKVIIESVMIDISAISKVTEMPPLDLFFTALRAVFFRAIDLMREIKEAVGNSGLKMAEEVSSAIGGIVAFIQPSIDALVAMATYTQDANLAANLAMFSYDMGLLIPALILLSATLARDGLKAAEEILGYAQGIIGFVKPGIESISALGDLATDVDVAGQLALFGPMVTAIITVLVALAGQLNLEATEAAALFYEAAGKVIGFIKPAIDGLLALGDLTAISDLPGKLALLSGMVSLAVIELNRLATTTNVGFSEAALAFFEGVKKGLGLISPAVSAFQKLAEFTAVAQLPAQMEMLTGQMEIALTSFRDLAERMLTIGEDETTNLDKTSKFADIIDNTFKGIKNAVDSITKLKKLTENLNAQTVWNTFMADINVLLNGMAAASDTLEQRGLAIAQRFYSAAEQVALAIRAAVNLLTTLGEGSPGAAASVLQQLADVVSGFGGLGGMTPALAGVGAGGGAPAAAAGTPTAPRSLGTLTLLIRREQADGSFVTEERVIDLIDERLGEIEV